MADPVAAANALAGQTYADAQNRTAQGKQALLDQLSSNGTYSNAIDQSAVQQASPQAIQPGTVAGGPDSTGHAAMIALAQHGSNQIQAQNQAALTAAATLAAQQRASQQQSASTYFDQVQQALPIEQSRAASSAAQVLEQLQAQHDAQAAAKAQAAIQLQISQNELAKSKLASSSPYGTNAPFNSPNEALAFKTAAEKQAGGPIQTLLGTNADGSAKRTPQYLAATELVNNPKVNLLDLARKYGLSAEDQQQVTAAVNSYNGNLGQVGYFQLLGLPVPPPVAPPASVTAPSAFLEHLKHLGATTF